jgi:transcriptional regulator with GAF, ATPase, and Fis domain
MLANAAKQGYANEPLTLSALLKIEPGSAIHWTTKRKAPTRPTLEIPSARTTLRQRTALENALSQHAGNVASVARELGVTRAQIYRWMGRLGIDIKFARGRG